MEAVNKRFWSRPTDRLLAVLNDNVTVTLATFAANTALGAVVNASLDAINLLQFPVRAPVEPGRTDITFDGTQFVYVPPDPESEPVPDPGLPG
jgi:hypothetical protein